MPKPSPSTSNGKVALVTGGAIRIGRAISLGLARAGFDLAVNYRSSGVDARSLESEIVALGRRCLLIQADVASEDQVAAMASSIESEFGRLDLLVNSASVFHSADLLSVSVDDWDHVMAVNLRGPFLIVRSLATLLKDASGSVVNIVDVSALEAWTAYPHHAVSKAALLHLTKVMARALAPAVRVNALAPGSVLLPEGTDDVERERLRRKTLVGHIGKPDDVVRTVLFLERSPFITGELIVVDGGRSVR